MLRMFSTLETEANATEQGIVECNTSTQSEICHSGSEALILERLSQVVQAQARQEELIRSVDRQANLILTSSDRIEDARSCKVNHVDLHVGPNSAIQGSSWNVQANGHNMYLRSPSHKTRKNATRKSSWTWDPQVQQDLEHSFKAICTTQASRSKRSHATENVESKSTTSLGDHADRLPTSANATSSGENHAMAYLGSDRLSSDSVRGSTTRFRWKQATAYRCALWSMLETTRSTCTASMRRPIAPVKTALRSSWLYRQRAAGRLSSKEQGKHLRTTLCVTYALCWLPIVRPSGLFAMLWDWIVAAAVLYIATFVPLQVAFDQSLSSRTWHVLNLTCDVIFMVKPILCFRRGFTHDGVYINDPVFIAAHYLRGAFVADAIAAVPLTWLFDIRGSPKSLHSTSHGAAERLVPLLRVVRVVVPIARRLSMDDNQARSGIYRLNPGLTRLMWLVVLLVYTCHWIGCLWWCVGELEQDGMITYGVHQNVRTDPDAQLRWGPSPWLRNTQSMANQYGHAFLWGAAMMTGFVPMDVTPSTLLEVIVTILALLFGFFVNTAIISSTTSALQSISFKSSYVVHKMQNVAQHMRHKRVPAALAQKILGFYEYQLSPYRSGEGQHDLSDLPPMLAMDLIMHTHQDLFRDCPIFRLVPPPTALSLVERFEPVVFVPGEIVIHEGKPNAALYVINRGLVSVWRHDDAHADGRKALTTLTDSDFFGEQTLLKTITSATTDGVTANKANATCQCASYCDMLRLTSEDFISVIEEARCHQASWEGKDVASILNNAADERNLRADRLRKQKRSLLWAAAGRAALRQNREQNKCKDEQRFGMSSMRLREQCSPFTSRGSRRRVKSGGQQVSLPFGVVVDAAIASTKRDQETPVDSTSTTTTVAPVSRSFDAGLNA